MIENIQNKKGMNPISSPNQKNLMNKKFFFKNIYGISDNNGTKTKKVFIMKAKPIQIPKSRILNVLFLLFILTKANIPIVTKHEKIIS